MSKKPTTQTYQRTYQPTSSKDELDELLGMDTAEVTPRVIIKELAPVEPEAKPEVPTLSPATLLEMECGRETLKKYVATNT